MFTMNTLHITAVKLIRTSLVVSLCFFATRASSDVRVAPTSVFMTDRATSGKLFLDNSGTEPQEVELSLIFGYLASDRDGAIHVATDIRGDDTLRSSAGWMKIFPSKVRLAPHTQQTVRITAYPLSGLPDGEYWSRVVVSTRKPADVRLATETIATQIDLVIQTLVPVMFRKGKVETGVAITEAKADRDSTGTLVVHTTMQRSGNATFLGRLVVRLHNPDGKIVAEEANEVAVYYTITRKATFRLPDAPRGEYTIELLIDTERSDLQQNFILPVKRLTTSLGFDIE